MLASICDGIVKLIRFFFKSIYQKHLDYVNDWRQAQQQAYFGQNYVPNHSNSGNGYGSGSGSGAAAATASYQPSGGNYNNGNNGGGGNYNNGNNGGGVHQTAAVYPHNPVD